MKKTLALIAINARRHYAQRANVPVWNPTLGAFYCLVLKGGKPTFISPSVHTWALLDKAGKRGAKAVTPLYVGLPFTPHHATYRMSVGV